MTAVRILIVIAAAACGYGLGSRLPGGKARNACRAGRSDALDERLRRAFEEVDSYGGTD